MITISGITLSILALKYCLIIKFIGRGVFMYQALVNFVHRPLRRTLVPFPILRLKCSSGLFSKCLTTG